jgi:hypothetical protein
MEINSGDIEMLKTRGGSTLSPNTMKGTFSPKTIEMEDDVAVIQDHGSPALRNSIESGMGM